MFTLTDTTCGINCWGAQEEECRCSCHGRNHGILRKGGDQPNRQARIHGDRYELLAVGEYHDLQKSVSRSNADNGHGYNYSWSQWATLPVIMRPASKSERKWAEVAGFIDPAIAWKLIAD